MKDHQLREEQLREILYDNFIVAKFCRKAAGVIFDASLKYYFQGLASRRNKFAVECAEEISFFGGKNSFINTEAFHDRWARKMDYGSDLRILKKTHRIFKRSRDIYNKALGKVNDGACREILLRHRSHLETTIAELKELKKLAKQQKEQLNQSKNQEHEIH